MPFRLVAFSFAVAFSAGAADSFSFRHRFVDDALPGSRWGQTALADLDRDGDLDFITGQGGGEIRWYEFTKKGGWKVHRLGTRSPSDVGGAVLDVNRDGRLDFVTGGAWYLQPEDPASGPWPRVVFDRDLRAVHDVEAADLNGNGRKEIITMSDRNDLRFYTIPASNPKAPWKKRKIYESVHAGLAAGDIDRDGDIDLVRSRIWLENLDHGKRWKEHLFCGIPWAERRERFFFYHATRACISDVNGDGRVDIVLTEGEIPGGRAAWFEAPKDPRKVPWKAHVLPESAAPGHGPYHSLQVRDFDSDGDPDIFAGEMEHMGKPPYRWIIWENRKGDGSLFVKHVILDKGLGTHEARAGDVDGDGDIDLVGKLWRPAPGNGNRGRNHVDFLENPLRGD